MAVLLAARTKDWQWFSELLERHAAGETVDAAAYTEALMAKEPNRARHHIVKA